MDTFVPQADSDFQSNAVPTGKEYLFDKPSPGTRSPEDVEVRPAKFNTVAEPTPLPSEKTIKPWQTVKKELVAQGIRGDLMEDARNAYFLEAVAPTIPTGLLTSARVAFDEDTRPSLVDKASNAVHAALDIVGLGTRTQAAVSPPAAAFARSGTSRSADPRVDGGKITRDTPTNPAMVAATSDINDSNAPVSDETYATIKGKYEGASKDERERMVSGDTVQARVARTIHEGYTRLDADLLRIPALSIVDSRIEARIARYRDARADPKTAENMARGEMLTQEPAHRPSTATGSVFDFDTAKALKPDGTVGRMVARGAYIGGKQVKQQVLGIHQLIGDVLGADEYAAVMGHGHDQAQRELQAAGETTTAFEKNFESAIATTINTAPALVVAIGTGGQTLPLVMMGSQVFGQEYSNGRAAGLDKGPAMARAGIQGAAEVIGQKLSLGATTTAMRQGIRRAVDAVQDAPVEASKDALSDLFLKSLAKENLGRQLTTAVEYWSDTAPIIGTKQANATDYLRAVADALVQTTIHSAFLAGAGAGSVGTARLARRRAETGSEAAPRVDNAKTDALAKWEKIFHPEERANPRRLPNDEPGTDRRSVSPASSSQKKPFGKKREDTGLPPLPDAEDILHVDSDN